MVQIYDSSKVFSGSDHSEIKLKHLHQAQGVSLHPTQAKEPFLPLPSKAAACERENQTEAQAMVATPEYSRCYLGPPLPERCCSHGTKASTPNAPPSPDRCQAVGTHNTRQRGVSRLNSAPSERGAEPSPATGLVPPLPPQPAGDGDPGRPLPGGC